MKNAETTREWVSFTRDTLHAYYMDPDDFSTTEIEDLIPIGSIVMTYNQTTTKHSDYGTELVEHSDARFYIVEEKNMVEYDQESIAEYLKPILRKFIIEHNFLPPSVRLRGVSKGLKLRVVAQDNKFYLNFNITLNEDDVPGDSKMFALGLIKTENRTSWRLEVDPSGRAKCKKCKRKIPKGSFRFVQENTFYGHHGNLVKRHLGCMTSRNFGYIDPRTIPSFDKLPVNEKERILKELMGWRYHFMASSGVFSSLSKDERFTLQNVVLRRMDFGIDLLDVDILDEIRSKFQENDFQLFRKSMSQIAYSALKKQLENNGLTLFLDTDKMKQIPELAALVPSLIELRQKETNDCIISEQDGTYDLRALWLTHWGFKLLRTSRSRRLTTSKNTFAKVEKLLATAGFSLTIKKRKTTPIHVKMSDDMREYIWSHGQANEDALNKFKLVFLKR